MRYELARTLQGSKEKEMKPGNFNRREFIKNSSILLGAAAIPLKASGQTVLSVRPEWQTFKTTSHYDSLLKAISLMKANTDASNPNSWTYWTNIHRSYCPHGVAYFLAWHRGYIYYFERQLRAVSGNLQLVLPYWDYYSYANLPGEFTNPTSGNPLYAERVNTNVRQALTMAPFSSNLYNFQTGTNNAFEPNIEGAPHNQLHNLIGNLMSTMSSPLDPIFWLHHANIDRLWVAWVNAGGNRKMPAINKPYWNGRHTYATTLTMLRTSTYGTRTTLGYRYANEAFPTQLPLAQVSPSNILKVQATPESSPAIGSFKISSPRQTSDQTFSVTGALNVGLDQRSISAQLPVTSEHSGALSLVAAGRTATIPGNPKSYRSAQLVLDHIEISDLGKKGGYFYKIYLNILPAKGLPNRPASIYIGSIGPFEISAATHHAGHHARLRYPIRQALAGASLHGIGMMSVSFVRVNGDHSPEGGVIGLGEVRVELSTESED